MKTTSSEFLYPMARSNRRQKHSATKPSFWNRNAEYALYVLLLAAITLGGAPNGAGIRIIALCVVAAIALATTFAANASYKFAELPSMIKTCAILIVAIPLIQLLPLPPLIWEALPGRELSAQIFDLIGTRDNWHTISVVPRQTLFAVAMLLPPVAAFLATLSLNEGGRQRAAFVFLAFVSLSVLVGFIQFATSGTKLDFYDTAHRGSFLGFFANRNHQGLLMGVGAVFAVFAARSRLRDTRVALVVSALLTMVFLIAAIATLSRAGIALTLLGALAALYIGFAHGKVRMPIVAAGGLAAILAFYFVSFSARTQAALDRFSNLEENERWKIWEKSWPLIEQYAPIGSGVGSYTTIYRTIEKLEDVTRFYYNRIHNDYLELALETGALGLLALTLFAVAFIAKVISMARGQTESGPLSAAGAITIVLFALHSTVDYPLRTQSGAVIFAFATALVFASPTVSIARRDREGEEHRSWSDRSTKMKAMLATVQAMVLSGFVVLAQAQRTAELPGDVTSSALIRLEDEEALPLAQMAQAKRFLARQPLDQTLLNTVFTSEVRSDTVSAQNVDYIAALKALGWRDTTTQQNLLFIAANKNDLEGALDNIDALLRRSKLIDELLPILIQFESDPDGLPLIAERIQLDPPWRERYFSLAYPLADPDTLKARLELFEYLDSSGFELTRQDKLVTLRAMMRADRRGDLVALARSQMPQEGKGQLLFDSQFDRTLDLTSEQRADPLPFEWRLTSQSGVSTRIIAEGWNSRLVLRWNGRGAPIIARSMTFLTQGQQPELEVSLSASSSLNGLDALRFTLICPGVREVLFVRKTGGAANSGIDRRSAYFEAEDGAPCDYPELYIGGRPSVGDRGADISIDAIKLTLP